MQDQQGDLQVAADAALQENLTQTSLSEEQSHADINLDAAIAKAGNDLDSPYESSDLSTSSEDSSSESEGEEPKSKEIEPNVSHEEEEHESKSVLKTRNEIVDIQINRPQFEMTETTTMVPLGYIYRIIDNVVVIQGMNQATILDMGSLIVYQDREIMGEVFETFGPVIQPFYSVRFNSIDDIDTERAVQGAKVFYVPEYENTRLVEMEKVRAIEGTDASNLYDEEIGEDEMEFSDDEKELAYKRMKNEAKKRKRGNAPKPPVAEPIPYSNEPFDEFDSYMAASSGRKLQSYADIADTPMENTTNDQCQPRKRPLSHVSPHGSHPSQPMSVAGIPSSTEQDQQPAAPSSPSSSPSLVSTFFGSYASQNPIVRSVRSLFAKPPPPASTQEEDSTS